MTFTTIKLRRGLAAAWTAANPVLADGEPGYEEDTGLLKLGDGVMDWNSLPYQPGGGGGGGGGPRALTQQAGDYTLALADAQSVVELTSASQGSFTIPANADVDFPLDTEIECVQAGLGQLVIVPAAGVTLDTIPPYPGGPMYVATAPVQHTSIRLRQRDIDEWVLRGDQLGPTAPPPYMGLVLAEASLLNYWPLADASSPLEDLGPSPNPLIVNGSGLALASNPTPPGLDPAHPVSCYFGDDSYLYATNPVTFAGHDSMTIEAWVQYQASTGGPVIELVDTQTGPNVIPAPTDPTGASITRTIYVGASGHVYGVISSGGSIESSSDTPTDGLWHHIAFVVSDDGSSFTTVTLYIDGAVAASDGGLRMTDDTTRYWRLGGGTVVSGMLGAWADAPTGPFLGNLAHVAVYGAALSADDVAAHHASGVWT